MFVLITATLFPTVAFANSEMMMGDQQMMWGGRMRGWGLLAHGLYSLIPLVVIVIFFWLLFRIARMFEAIANAKKEE